MICMCSTEPRAALQFIGVVLAALLDQALILKLNRRDILHIVKKVE